MKTAEDNFMHVRYFSESDKEIFLELCREFYNSHATLRPYDESVAEKTFRHVIDHHENLWGYLIYESEESDSAAGYALLTTYWCNEEGGNVLLLDELYTVPNIGIRDMRSGLWTGCRRNLKTAPSASRWKC